MSVNIVDLPPENVAAVPLGKAQPSHVRDIAISYIERGWAVVPIEHAKKRPPLHMAGWQNLRMTVDEVDRYFTDPALGIGVILGEASKQLVDIDLDCLIAGRIAHRWLPKTQAVFGRPGKPESHWLYVSPGSITKKFVDPCSDEDSKATIVEIRSTGTQTVFPPSVHVSGEPIRWVTTDIEPGIVSPDELLSRVSHVAAAALLARHFPPEGARDDFAFALAGGLIKGGMDEHRAEMFVELVASFGGANDVNAKARKPAAVARAQRRGKTIVGFSKLRKIIPPPVVDSVVDWLGLSTKLHGQRDSCTDAANGARFASMHGDEAVYVPQWRKWLVWDEIRWVVDDRDSTRLMAVDTAKAIHDEAKVANASEERELSKWAINSQQQNRLSAMLWVAQSHLAIASEELDADRWLLNIQNGTLDLRTDEFRGHSRTDRLTKVASVAYDPEALAPGWESFLDEVLEGQSPLIDFVRRAAGYTLTGDIGEQCVFFLEGGGANGKTTFIEVLRRILGDYGRPAEFRTLMERRNSESVRNDLAALRGLRMVSAGEPSRRQKFDEPLLKLLTGGDRITARYLYAEYFDFDPAFKIWLAANHRPRVDGTDDGIWRRIHVIEFHASIPPERRVPNLVDKLIRDEGPGILNWMLRGLREWRTAGLGVPEEVRDATRRYREENDALGLFLQECCEVDESRRGTSSRFFVTSAHLKEAYLAWCKDQGETPLGLRELSSLLQERGFANDAKWHEGQQRRCYFGLRLKDDSPF